MAGNWFAWGALLAGLSVGAGAFGAHGLAQKLDADALAVWKTAAEYQMYHALGLLAVSWAADQWDGGLPRAAGWCFLLGILFFSGSLYALALTGIKVLGAITPLGGGLFLVGWVLLAVAAFKAGS